MVSAFAYANSRHKNGLLCMKTKQMTKKQKKKKDCFTLDLGVIGKIFSSCRKCQFWSKVMTSEVEERPSFVTGGYGRHRSQWVNESALAKQVASGLLNKPLSSYPVWRVNKNLRLTSIVDKQKRQILNPFSPKGSPFER